jgi:tRNA(Ile)-lysidine synthase
MNAIESALTSAISKYPKMPLVIAYSGGVDSQVLLHALASLSQKDEISNDITVCHVNHGLSKNANDWQLFAQKTCAKLNLNLEVSRVNIQEQAQQSLEALARKARYKALQSIYNEPALIITGHHSDDQAETFLLALKRGSGLKGLSAMAIESKRENDLLLRPLLKISRAEIIDYANQFSLTWVEDESNTDTHFDRNFIRNEIVPLLSNRWPSIVNTINRSSEHCREGQLLLNELAAEDLTHCQCSNNRLLIEPLSQLSQARFNNVIRYFLQQKSCLMPSTQQLAQLYHQLSAGHDKNPAVKLGDNYLRRYKGCLYLTIEYKDISHWQRNVSLSEVDNFIELPDDSGKLCFFKAGFIEPAEGLQQVALPSKETKITIRFNHNNPSCLPEFRKQSRRLKKVLQELNIPPWQRKRIPFLYYDDVLVAAIGFFICQGFLPHCPLSQSLPSNVSSLDAMEPRLTISWTP